MDRIPLLAGTSTPDFVEKVLAVFGNNPHGEPNFRLIWSERKQIFFAGDISPEYIYLPHPCWVLETWISPEKDAGKPEHWSEMQEALMGPYPRKGTYNHVQTYPENWFPTEESVRLIAKGIIESRDIEIAARIAAIKANKEAEATAARLKVADAMVELQDSASLGKIQQSVSGPKNTFRTPDDWGRDAEKTQKTFKHLPKSGGTLIGEL